MHVPKRISTAFKPGPYWSKDDLDSYPWLKKTTRYYSLDAKLGEGAFGTAYVGYPYSKLNGKKPIPNAPKIVVKLPKIDLGGYTTQENRARLDYIRAKNHKEFQHFKERLRGCLHANPIIDLASLTHGELELPVTIQPYLENGCDLDQWLVKMELRPQMTKNIVDRPDVTTWNGIDDRAKWVAIALQIARAIKDIHLRRMRHGDIHPGNLFLRIDNPHTVTLIDFGEGFIATPDINWRQRNPKPYLAPERLGSRFQINEQVDVYSFGILMLYLATGSARELSLERHPGLHRSYIHDLIHEANPALVRHEPRISDLIGRSTARDPADRPRMIDICDDLLNISSSADSIHHTRDGSGALTLERLTTEMELAANKYSPVLMSLLDRQIRELATVFDGLQTEMVELYGTRDQMLRVMISLLEHLQLGDSWTAATTLAVWQRSALGLNGSYASANVRAIRRDAGVRRTFVISIAELGFEFSEKLAATLNSSNNDYLKHLGKLFNIAIAEYATKRTRDYYKDPTPEFVNWHRMRLVSVVQCMRDLIAKWELASYLTKDQTIKIEQSKGLYIGVCPVATLDDVGAIREDNPVSLMHFAKEKDDARRWLLVTTEVRGRNESRDGIERPQLLGVRVYKSVMGKPTDRIQYLEKLMNKLSANVTTATGQLFDIVSKVDKEV
jgi:serine/threonine protein kinase